MTCLVMVFLAFFGILSYLSMPVSDLPSIDFPTIQVSISYPGASPETVANNVVVPLEQQFSTINGIQSISSTSYTGSATILLIFDLDKNIDLAAPDVQSAINAASAQLPKNLPYAPTYVKANPTATPILFYSLYSETLSLGELYDYAHSLIAQRLNMIEGVSQVQTFGTPYAVRVRVDPRKLASRSTGIDEVATAIQKANVYIPTGTLYGESKEYTIRCSGQIYEADKYNPLIIKEDTNTGAIVRLKDVGYAFAGLQNDKMDVQFLDKESMHPTVGIAIQKDPASNTLATIEKINQILPELEKSLPASVKIFKLFDKSSFIEESVVEVQFTLAVALFLVVVVIFFYLGTLIDTFIPTIAIPISVISAFILMYNFGYNIDILSLLAITLSIGFLVDDAIVVLENIVRHVEMGKPTLQAAFDGSKEISFTILSMTLCLASIFIPLIFMGGIVGRMLHELALTIVIIILISGAISLSLTPLLCSRLVKEKKKEEKPTKAAQISNALNSFLLNLYRPSLHFALRHRKWVSLIGLASVALTLVLAMKLPKDFLPSSDIGFIQTFTMAEDGTSPFELTRIQKQLGQTALKNLNISAAVAVSASPQDNQGKIFLKLKDDKKRDSAWKVVDQLYEAFQNTPGANVLLRPMPLINLQVGTTTSKADYQFSLQSLNADDLYKYVPILEEKMKMLRGFGQVNSDLDVSQPQLSIEILRDKASMLGITAEQIENNLQYAFANVNLSPINQPQNQYYVIMEVLPEFYRNPSKLSEIWLTSSSGNLVPLSSVIKTTETLGPLTINHLDGIPSATISFNIVDIPLQTALESLQNLADETLPPSIHGQIQGSASIFKSSFADLAFLLIITFFVVYVILGVLYESFSAPITVMSTLPPAALGALLSLMICRETLSLYAVVGIIMLLGIVMKNGIILIDFALIAIEEEKLEFHEAITKACLVRFRPILMTTFAALMGAVPIALGIGGEIAESRKSLGISIVGGLLFSQVLTLYFTPVTFTYIEGAREWIRSRRMEKKLKVSDEKL
jgi:HAE1 family hydrophobic/amphiphilic exporter-1